MYLFRQRRRAIRLSIPIQKNVKDAFLDLPEEEQKELCRMLKAGDKTVIPRLAASFYGVALYIAAQYGSSRRNFIEDLFSEAVVGIMMALDNISEMYNDDIRPFVMSKIQTRCSNYFNKTDDAIISNNERYRRAINGDHRKRRPITTGNVFFDMRPDTTENKNYKELVDDLYEAANTYRRRKIVGYYIQGYSKAEIAKLVGVSNETIRNETNEIEYRYLSILAKRVEEDRDA